MINTNSNVTHVQPTRHCSKSTPLHTRHVK